MLEYLKISFFIIVFTGLYAVVNDDDYHKRFDKEVLIRYNCDITGDVPKEVIEKCKFSERNYVYIKTYQE